MKIGDKDYKKESFTDFVARFHSKAVLGKVILTN